MSTQIQFTPGRPQRYTATRSFALGNSGVTVPKGAEIEFDGHQVSYAGSPPVAMPTLRGAIRVGWMVPAEQYDPSMPDARPRSANIQVRKADGGNPMDVQSRAPITQVQAEEQEVANVQQHAAQTRQNNQTNYRRGSENRAVMPGTVEVEPQEGIPVRTLQTPTRMDSNLEKDNPQALISRANSVQVQPGQGRSREEMLAAMDPETRAEYEARLGAHKAAYVDEPAPVVARLAAPQTQQKEGFTVHNEVGGGVETVDLGGTGTAGPDQVQVIEQDGIKFTTTNGPKKDIRLVDKKPTAPAAPLSNQSQDVRRKVAKTLCPDFPDIYNFDDPVRKKIARIQADFDDRPDVIQAVFAAETDEVKERLMQEFPEAFA